MDVYDEPMEKKAHAMTKGWFSVSPLGAHTAPLPSSAPSSSLSSSLSQSLSQSQSPPAWLLLPVVGVSFPRLLCRYTGGSIRASDDVPLHAHAHAHAHAYDEDEYEGLADDAVRGSGGRSGAGRRRTVWRTWSEYARTEDIDAYTSTWYTHAIDVMTPSSSLSSSMPSSSSASHAHGSLPPPPPPPHTPLPSFASPPPTSFLAEAYIARIIGGQNNLPQPGFTGSGSPNAGSHGSAFHSVGWHGGPSHGEVPPPLQLVDYHLRLIRGVPTHSSTKKQLLLEQLSNVQTQMRTCKQQLQGLQGNIQTALKMKQGLHFQQVKSTSCNI